MIVSVIDGICCVAFDLLEITLFTIVDRRLSSVDYRFFLVSILDFSRVRFSCRILPMMLSSKTLVSWAR
jgi:hypothetical protein